MPETQRLKELLKQKELVESHLQWIEAEIAKERQATPKPKETNAPAHRLPQTEDASTQPAPTDSLYPPENAPQQEQVLGDLYSELGPNTKSAVRETKRGCFIAFGLAMLAFGGLVWLIYYLY